MALVDSSFARTTSSTSRDEPAMVVAPIRLLQRVGTPTARCLDFRGLAGSLGRPGGLLPAAQGRWELREPARETRPGPARERKGSRERAHCFTQPLPRMNTIF